MSICNYTRCIFRYAVEKAAESCLPSDQKTFILAILDEYGVTNPENVYSTLISEY